MICVEFRQYKTQDVAVKYYSQTQHKPLLINSVALKTKALFGDDSPMSYVTQMILKD